MSSTSEYSSLPNPISIALDSILLPSIKNAVGTHLFEVQLMSVWNANKYKSLCSLESQNCAHGIQHRKLFRTNKFTKWFPARDPHASIKTSSLPLVVADQYLQKLLHFLLQIDEFQTCSSLSVAM